MYGEDGTIGGAAKKRRIKKDGELGRDKMYGYLWLEGKMIAIALCPLGFH